MEPTPLKEEMLRWEKLSMMKFLSTTVQLNATHENDFVSSACYIFNRPLLDTREDFEALLCKNRLLHILLNQNLLASHTTTVLIVD